MDKKQIALQLIKPYYSNPELCAIDSNGYCQYLIGDKKCVVGQCMTDEALTWVGTTAISELLNFYGEPMLFKREFSGIFTREEWRFLQSLHDCIAKSIPKFFHGNSLFTIEEFIAYDPI